MSGDLTYNVNCKYLIYFSLKLHAVVNFQVPIFGLENMVPENIGPSYFNWLNMHCGTKRGHLSWKKS